MTTMPASTRPGLLLLGGGASPLLRDLTGRAVAAARARGMRVHLTGSVPALKAIPGLARQVDAVSAVDSERPEECVGWARARAAAGERFDVVLGVREYAQVAAAEVAAALGAPGNPPEAVRVIRAKDACRGVLAAAGLHQPRFAVCAGAEDARAFLASCAGPWIIKPRDAMGSVGVSLVEVPADLPHALAALPGTGPFLAEQYVPGPEYSVEGVFTAGAPRVLAVTGKETLPPPNFVEIGHVQPAELAPAARARIESAVTTALRVLGLRFGIFHVEVWLTDTGPVLGEVHGRTGGDWIHLLLDHTRGVDMYGMVYDDALGRPVRAPAPATRAAAVGVFATGPGTGVAIEGYEAAARHPAVVRAECGVGVGDTVAPIGGSEDRVGSLVVRAGTAAEATDLAARLAESVRFVTRRDAPERHDASAV